jgi:phosphomannomutase
MEDDAERCCVLNELGRPVQAVRLLVLFAKNLTDKASENTIVVEDATPPDVVRDLRKLGAGVATSPSRRAAMYRAMREHSARLGGGPTGRFWYGNEDGHVSADAVASVTHLLRILSRSDRQLSEVLDAEVAVD